MLTTTRYKTIIYFIVILCSSSILAKKDVVKSEKVKIEFFWESVNNGIIQKFKDHFYTAEVDDNQLNNENISFESTENSFYISDSEATDEYFKDYIESNKVLDEYGSIPNEYKKHAEKLCLLTVIAKETTIYYKENSSV
jgi:hypothetical protein